MSNMKLMCSVCVLGALFTIQGKSQEVGRRVKSPMTGGRQVLHQGGDIWTGQQGGGGFDGGGIKPLPEINPYSSTQASGRIMNTGPQGNTASGQFVPVIYPTNRYRFFHGYGDGQAIIRPEAGTTFSDGANVDFVWGDAGQPTSAYERDWDNDVTAPEFSWRTGTPHQFAPTPERFPYGTHSEVWPPMMNQQVWPPYAMNQQGGPHTWVTDGGDPGTWTPYGMNSEVWPPYRMNPGGWFPIWATHGGDPGTSAPYGMNSGVWPPYRMNQQVWPHTRVTDGGDPGTWTPYEQPTNSQGVGMNGHWVVSQ